LTPHVRRPLHNYVPVIARSESDEAISVVR
jgi:hypothetical protein